MELSEIRREIDKIDEQLVALFCQRMALSAQVADYKKAHDLPIFVPQREQEILRSVADQAGDALAEPIQKLYSALFEISREYQKQRNEVI